MKVLIVEDNEMNRDVLSRRLARRGCDVIVAVDGQEGVERARAERPRVVVMDLSLPVLDGWEATRRLKADPATADIPVVALTAHAFTEDRDRALASGCAAFLTKPLDFRRLVDTLEAVTGVPLES